MFQYVATKNSHAKQALLLQTHLGNVAGLAPDHCDKSSIAVKRVIFFAGGESCLQLVKNTTSVKHIFLKMYSKNEVMSVLFYRGIRQLAPSPGS